MMFIKETEKKGDVTITTYHNAIKYLKANGLKNTIKVIVKECM